MPASEMNALVKARPAPGASFEPRPRPQLGPNDVLVAVQAASICGTDLHIYSWDPVMRQRIRPPMIFGHEFCGTVEGGGSEVEAVRPGQFVSAEMHVACGHCLQCRLGQQHICQKLEIIGIDRDGCFAQFVKIPASNILPIDPAIPRDFAALLDPLGNAVHTVLAGESAGQRVAVMGCGPIGLMAVMVAKACGASAVYGIEVRPERIELAKRGGAGRGLPPPKNPAGAGGGGGPPGGGGPAGASRCWACRPSRSRSTWSPTSSSRAPPCRASTAGGCTTPGTGCSPCSRRARPTWSRSSAPPSPSRASTRAF